MRGLLLTVPRDLDGERLDVVIARLAPEISRRAARRLIGDGAVLVGGQRTLVQSRTVRAGTSVEVHMPDGAPAVPGDGDGGDGATEGAGAAPERVNIIAMEPGFVAVDKPAGMPTEPTRQGARGTLLHALHEALRARGEDVSFLAAAHRLDTHTSGVVIFARTRAVAAVLGAQLAAQSVDRRYLALVDGLPPFESARFDRALARKPGADGRIYARPEAQGGAPALTLARVLARGVDGALLWCAPQTGRTHQIRVHLADAGHPLVDDRRYARPRRPSPHPGLHALAVTLAHPVTGATATFAAPPAPRFVEACAARGITPDAVAAAVARVLEAPAGGLP